MRPAAMPPLNSRTSTLPSKARARATVSDGMLAGGMRLIDFLISREFSPTMVVSSMLSAQAIKNHHSDIFTFLHGNLQSAAVYCHVPEDAMPESLVYVTDAAQLSEARRHKPAILIVHAKVADSLCPVADADSCCFSVKNIPMGMAILLKYFDDKASRFTQWGERHPTAVVHCDAIIGQGVFLGPYCVIGAGANIGDGCMIGAHAVVENGAKIGARCILHPQVFVGA